MALKGPPPDAWIDLAAISTSAYAYTDRPQEAAHYLDIFIETLYPENYFRSST